MPNPEAPEMRAPGSTVAILHLTRNLHSDEFMVSLRSTVSRTSPSHLLLLCVRVGWRREISIPKGSLVASRFVMSPFRLPGPRVDPYLKLGLLPPPDLIPYLGGWWTRPSNWKANTAIAFAGIIGATYGVWGLSADKEVRACYPLFGEAG